MAQSFINADDQKALGMDFLGGPVVKDSELPMGEFHGAWVPPLVWKLDPPCHLVGPSKKTFGEHVVFYWNSVLSVLKQPSPNRDTTSKYTCLSSGT